MACALRLAFLMCIPVPSAVYPPLERLPGLPVTGGYGVGDCHVIDQCW